MRPDDGRTARATRTRQAIIDACLELVEEGDLQPTTPRVAERAGVSVRSVFQHFDDIEGLFAAVADRVLERLAGLVLCIDPTLDIERRLPLVARQRAALLEVLTPIRRASLVNGWDSVVVTERLRLGQAYLRAEVEGAFAGELDAAGDGRDQLLVVLDTVLSWATWEHIRTSNGLDVPAATAVVERLLRAALGLSPAT
jgi:TetR/AcrR family transcriptional regulator of autoinduction and epiphytic fitness